MCYELVIVGAGLTGIRAAITAQELGMENVLVIDYEKKRGGFSSSLFERDEFQKEKELIEKSKHLPYEFWFQSTVVGFFAGEDGENHQISVQTPSGSKDIEAKKVILSSGSLEKPREGHKIAGSRPAGIMTPVMALGLLERNHVPGQQVVVIENGRIAKSVAYLLEENGSSVIRVSGENSKITNIKGNCRVNEVELQDIKTGEINAYSCDTLIFSKGTIPCTFYLKGTMIDLDKHEYVIVDDQGRTNIPGVFAFGSCTNQAGKFECLSDKTTDLLKDLLTV